jgi:peptidoglycan/xylan/chitin deacetylase (PgdA/CDA1 family)
MLGNQKEKLKHYIKKRGQIIEFFDHSPTSYIKTGNGTLELDTINYKTGNGALKLISNNNTTGVSAWRTVNWNLAEDGQYILVWVHCNSDPATTLTSMHIYLSADTGSSKRFRKTLLPMTVSGGHLVQGWNPIVLFKPDWTAQNGMTWNDPVIRLIVNIYPIAGQTADITIDSIYVAEKGTPIMVLTFDDNYKSAFENAWPIMEEKGILGTWYAISHGITNPNSFNLAVADWDELYQKGNDISNHTVNHIYCGQQSDINVLISEIQGNIDTLNSYGYNRASKFFGYPYGSYNALTFEALNQCGIISARGNVGYNRYPLREEFLISGNSSGPPATNYLNKYLIRSNPINSSKSLADAIAITDYVVANECCSFIMLHEIIGHSDTPHDAGTCWYTDYFEEWLNDALNKNVRFMTHSDWWFEGRF